MDRALKLILDSNTNEAYTFIPYITAKVGHLCQTLRQRPLYAKVYLTEVMAGEETDLVQEVRGYEGIIANYINELNELKRRIRPKVKVDLSIKTQDQIDLRKYFSSVI